ncbi:Arc family DNA-binding protein [uncultured Dysosmobacter sp.]|uniref:Arc family DNA-binding protein n=1 Tax=uncultured Dysosmobacter sp. TaxID=2591384 RepID=UPI002617B7D4|nr:Arc family DNA-binding protein [uncultured Dysosmobacter sp.]
MAVSKAQQASVNKYVKSNYDRINVTMPKGQKGTIKTHAAAQGESVNAFINRAIMEAMERDNAAQRPAAGQ